MLPIMRPNQVMWPQVTNEDLSPTKILVHISIIAYLTTERKKIAEK